VGDAVRPSLPADLHATKARRTEIAFVDTALAGWETLAAGIRASRPDIDIAPLDTASHAVAQMAAWAGDHRGYDAIHILSHGAPGRLYFGGETIDSPAALAGVAGALKAGGDLLLYGCNLASGEAGRRFVADLAAQCGATVTASTDFTGASALGGNWDLAERTGALNTATLRLDEYAGLLNLDSVMTNPTLTITLDRGVDPNNSLFAAQNVVGVSNGGSAVEWLDPTGANHDGYIEFLSPTGSVTSSVLLTGTPFAQLSSGSSELASLSNGDVVLTYSGQNGDTYFSVIGPGGVVVDPILVTSGSTAGQSTQLSNGDIAVTSVVGTALDINTYTQTGSAVGGVTISNASLMGANPIAGNNSGNFAVIYNSSADSQAHIAFYANGGSSPSATVALGASGVAQTVALSDGDFAVLTSDASYANLKLQIYTPTGAAVGSTISLPGVAGDIYLAADLTPGQQGVTVFSDNNDDGNIYAIRFDNAGNIVAGGTQSSQGHLTSVEHSGSGVEVYNGGGQYFLQDSAAGLSGGEINLYLNQSAGVPVLQTFELGAPAVSSIATIGNATNSASTEQFTVTFADSVTGVAASDFTATTLSGNVAATGISVTAVSATTYTVTVTGVTGDGTLRLDLKSNSTGITDTATGIAATAGFSGGGVYTIDHVPTVSSIAAVGASPNNATSEQFTVTFSEAVTGVDSTDFTATTLSGNVADTGITVTGSGAVYTVTVDGVTGTGTLRLDLNSSGTGIVGGGSAIASGFTSGDVYTVDHTPPTVASIVTAASSPNHASSETFTVTFSEAVTGVDASDFVAVTSGIADTGITVTPVSGSVYTVTVNGVTGDGTLGLNLKASGTGIADTVGNAISGGFTGQTYTVEHTPPSVSSIVADGANPSHATSEQFTVTFTEAVTGVTASDFTLTTANRPGGTALSTGGITSITGSGNTYTVTVGSVAGDGTLRLDLKSGSAGITDAAGNSATSGFTGGDTYTIEHTPPSVSSIAIDGTNPNNAGSEQYTVTFTEAVTGVDASDFTATTLSGNVANTGVTVTGSGPTYTVTVNGVTGDGTERLDLNSSGTGITDAAGNAIAGGFTGGSVYTIEHTAPAVTAVGVPASATYIAGQNIDFTVDFSEAVNVTGTPELALTLDSGTVDAHYVSGSGTSGLTFEYTVISGESASHGVAVGSAILLNGGTVKDAATNDAVLTVHSVADTSGVLVDSIPPTVTSVAAPANGTYGTGQALTFTVDFSENVLATTGGGTPYIDVTLDNGGTVHAAYAGGSGTNALTFSHTVASGNDDTNGVAVGSSIVLNGGSIKDAATNAAVLTLNDVASTTGVLVDAIPPTVTSIDIVDPGTNNLSTEHFTVTFSTAVHGVDASDFVLGGTGTVFGSIASVTGSGTTWTVTVNNVVGDGNLQLDLINSGDPITDDFGNTLTASHTWDQRYTIEHTPPAVTSIIVPGATTYGAGQFLDFIPTFSEAVTVTGTPRIAITLDTGGTVYADYVSGSGTNALTFQYEVKPGDQDLTGIATGTAIDLNGGTIHDAAGNAASGAGLNLTGEPSLAGVDVDAVVPAVSEVITPFGGTYGTGQDLYFSVNFNKVVNVNTAGGTPYFQITLDTGGTVDAVYLSGSGTSALTFRYVIVSGELDSNGITVGSNLVLNGATIQDAFGNNVATALNNVGSTSGILVDSILPTVTSIHTVDAGTNNLHTEHFTVTFSTAVTGVDATDFTVVGTNTVSGSIASVTGSGTTWTVTVNNVNGDGTLRLDLNNTGDPITDNFGNTLAAAHTGDQSYTILHTPPGAPTVVLAHDTGTSGTDGITNNPAITVTPAEAGGTLLYKIDGATSYSTTAPNFATNGSADGVHTVSVEQEDAAGNIGAPTTLSFTLDTTAPAAPTSAVSLAHDTGASATDHITNNPALVYASPAAGDYFLFKVDNGSYSTTQPAAFATDHSADGVHTISVEKVDAAGNISAPASFSFTLDTVAPVISAVTAAPSSGIEGVGQSLSIVVAFSEAVTLGGGTPTLSLNDNGTATYDAAVTAALYDATKLVFDYTVATTDSITSQLAVTGINLHNAAIDDAAGNVANLGNIDTTFTGLGVDSSLFTANPDSNHVLAGQTVSADAAHGVLANDTDSNPLDHVTVSAVDGLAGGVNQSVAGAYGTLTLHADGSYAYTASGTATGVEFDTFSYTAGNGHSPASSSTLTIEVIGGNQNYVQVPSGTAATGGYGNTVLDGSAGNATLTAATTFNAHQTLIGGPGDTLNAASYGLDTFVFANNFGHDTINNFHPALDVIQLQQSQWGSLANVMADIHQVGADSVLTLDANHVITIANTQHASLTAADFHLV